MSELAVTKSKPEFDRHRQALFLGVLCLVTYVPTFIWMWDRWWARDSYYSHGILIPFFSAFLIWQDREKLAEVKTAGSSWGLALIVPGLLIHLASSMFRVYFTSGYSLLLVLAGIVIFVYGTAFLRKILFPLLFLFFMLPVPLIIISNISFKMKLFAATIATHMLNSAGLVAIQEGSMIKMQHAHVIVDDVCSGLRSLISLTALGSVMAYWMKSTMFRRVLLFLSTIPIAVITNVCRIILLAFIAEVWGTEYATGFTHDASGFMVFALAFILLYAMTRLIE